jgi:hypothetical protein
MRAVVKRRWFTILGSTWNKGRKERIRLMIGIKIKSSKEWLRLNKIQKML